SVGPNEPETCFGNFLQYPRKRVNDEVPPLETVESSNKEHSPGIGSVQPPVFRGRLCRVGNDLRVSKFESIKRACFFKDITRRRRNGSGILNCPSFLLVTFSKSFICSKPERRADLKPRAMKPHANRKPAGFLQPPGPAICLFHLEDVQTVLHNGAVKGAHQRSTVQIRVGTMDC